MTIAHVNVYKLAAFSQGRWAAINNKPRAACQNASVMNILRIGQEELHPDDTHAFNMSVMRSFYDGYESVVDEECAKISEMAR